MALPNPTGMPDLQLRMSKKIAQLTKVIYHLNSRTEDHEQELQELTEQYEVEVEQILKDTTEKINFYKAQMEDAQDQRHIQEVARRLENKYEEEKRRCLSELDALRKRAADREAALQKASARQVEGLRQQVEDVQRQLQVKVKEVGELSKVAGSTSKELSDALAMAKQETEEAIQAGNKKYNEMLAERMRMEDQLIEQLKDAEARVSREQRACQDAQALLASERTRLEAELQAVKDRAAKSEEGWQARMTSHLEEQSRERHQAAEAAQAAAEAARQAAARIHELEDSLSNKDNECSSQKQDILSLTQQLEALRASAAQEADALSQALQQFRTELASLQDAASKDQAGAAQQLAAAAADRQRLEQQLTSMTDSYNIAQGLAQRTQEALDRTTSDLESTTARLMAAQREGSVTTQQLTTKITELEAKVRSLEDEVLRAVSSGKSDAAGVERALRDEMARQLAAQAAAAQAAQEHAAQEAAAQLAAAEAAARARLEAAQQQAQRDLEQLQQRLTQEHTSALQALQSQHDAALTELQSHITQLKEQVAGEQAGRQAALSQLSESQASGSAAAAASAQRIKELEGVEANLRSELNALRGSLQGSQDDVVAREAALTQLKQQVAALQQQADQDARAAAAHLTAELGRLDKEWSSRADRMVREAEAQRDASHRTALAALQQQLAEFGEGAVLAAQQAAGREMEAARRRWEEEMQGLRQQHAQAVSTAQSEHEAAIEALKRQHAAALDAATSSQAAAAASHQAASEAALRQQMEERFKTERATHQQEMEVAAAAHTKALLELQQRLTSQLDSSSSEAARKLLDLEARAKQASEEAARKLQMELSKLSGQHELAVSLLKQAAESAAAAAADKDKAAQRQLAALQAAKEALEADKAGLTARVSQVEEALMRKASEMAETVLGLKSSWADERQALAAGHKQQVQQLQEEQAAALAALQQQAEAAAAEAQDRYLALQSEYSHLRDRWDAREPRDEDVELIRKLQSRLRELEELVRTSEDRMAQLRAELLLREENYNKHFKNGGAGEKMLGVNAAMNAQAGVMEWMLKKKDSTRKGSGRNM